MKIRILRLTEGKAEFLLEETTPAMANALRRAILSEVPVMAVHEVIFFTNTTDYPDEYIAHRLAMIPIRTDLKNYSMDEGSVVTLRLDKEAQEEGVVYSGDLESSDPLIIPLNSRIPIVTMKRGQKLKFEAIVKLGKGKWHAKWQPVSGLRYSYTPIYEVLPEALPESCKDCESLEKNKNGILIIRDPYSCPKCAAELERMLNSGDSRVQIKWDATRIFMGFESNGQIPPFRIILTAADELIKKFDEFENKLKEALSLNKG